MFGFIEFVSAVSPAGDAIDGSARPPSRLPERRPRSGRAERVLSPLISERLAAMGVDMLCVEVISSGDVIVHNSPNWMAHRMSRTAGTGCRLSR